MLKDARSTEEIESGRTLRSVDESRVVASVLDEAVIEIKLFVGDIIVAVLIIRTWRRFSFSTQLLLHSG